MHSIRVLWMRAQAAKLGKMPPSKRKQHCKTTPAWS